MILNATCQGGPRCECSGVHIVYENDHGGQIGFVVSRDASSVGVMVLVAGMVVQMPVPMAEWTTMLGQLNDARWDAERRLGGGS